ncbi:hypothetical protein E8E11_010269 [Didymella keratinophila]|nr:hypothetical protein E8E11_010269 [Didymella keratinophila]
MAPLPSHESTTAAVQGDIEMEDAQQYSEEENGVGPNPAVDGAAPGKYFDYVYHIWHINTMDADPAAVHDQFYTDVPPQHFPHSEPTIGSSRETHDPNESEMQELRAQGTDALPRVSPKPNDVASVVATEERSNRKRSPSQTSSDDEPAAKKYKRVKGVFHPKGHA